MSMKNSVNGGNNKNNNKDEPKTAPQADRWYTLSLGSSFKDHQPSPKFCTLRYEFKPASIDKSQPGVMHKNKDNRVSVEFHNNQPGKPKVTFEGSSEDYKENDAVLFFDGETFRLEKLHKAVKRLRHVRQPGESTATAAAAAVGGLTSSVGVPAGDASSPPVGKGMAAVKGLNLNKSSTFNPVPVEVERIDIGDPGSSAGGKPLTEKIVDVSAHPNPSSASPDSKNDDLDEQLDIVNDDGDGFGTSSKENVLEKTFTGIDINMPHQTNADDEIADVDLNDDDADTGRNAAEALRAQVNAAGREEQTSSSSGSSGSDSSGSSSRSGSGSGSGSSSSSDSESSDGDSVNSI
ncbi:hypothetical protein Ancab_034831 [Ancistrocladus abbreviatus]